MQAHTIKISKNEQCGSIQHMLVSNNFKGMTSFHLRFSRSFQYSSVTSAVYISNVPIVLVKWPQCLYCTFFTPHLPRTVCLLLGFYFPCVGACSHTTCNYETSWCIFSLHNYVHVIVAKASSAHFRGWMLGCDVCTTGWTNGDGHQGRQDAQLRKYGSCQHIRVLWVSVNFKGTPTYLVTTAGKQDTQ